MSDKIKQLAEQAFFETEYDDLQNLPETIQRFAELVVQETIKEMISQMWHHGIDESNNPAFYRAVDKVKEHFEVKQ
jgi:hypothetical protein